MKKILILNLILLNTFPLLAEPVENKEEQGIVLTSEIINIIDGFAWGINANQIKLMLQLRRELKKIQFGSPNKLGKLDGHYLFDGRNYASRALAGIESSLELEYYQKAELYNQNKEANKLELQELDKWYNHSKKKLRDSLEIAKKEFNEKIIPFSKNAHGAKEQMLILIEESCKKRNRSDCFLLKWAETTEENEMVLFNDQIITFKAFDQFCVDLTNFLEDLMRSCPKGWSQFKKLMDEQVVHKAAK